MRRCCRWGERRAAAHNYWRKGASYLFVPPYACQAASRFASTHASDLLPPSCPCTPHPTPVQLVGTEGPFATLLTPTLQHCREEGVFTRQQVCLWAACHLVRLHCHIRPANLKCALKAAINMPPTLSVPYAHPQPGPRLPGKQGKGRFTAAWRGPWRRWLSAAHALPCGRGARDFGQCGAVPRAGGGL